MLSVGKNGKNFRPNQRCMCTDVKNSFLIQAGTVQSNRSGFLNLWGLPFLKGDVGETEK